ncbi:GNAT family N-acetyltransferase [Microbacterium sp.]|uniref:GNAT family N-acetyltransferase n=1 Tax=Microbacterium sp. TaxID=51671 RepID=UPI003A8CAB25
MSTITIEPATDDRFGDVQHALSGGGDGASCQCQWWMMRNKDWQNTSRADREDLLRDEVAAPVSPGLVAYVDGEAAGWVRVGPRIAQTRLAHTRTFAASPHAWDDPSVWAVSCFVVRREFRGQGLNRRLLDAAVAHARANGARAIEAYPVDVPNSTRRTNDLYIGILSVFLAAGFTEVARPKPDLAIVQLLLDGAA